MNCKRIKARLDLLAGDDLAGRDAAEVEAHLRTCLACYREYVAMRDLLAEVRANARPAGVARGADATESFVGDVMTRIEGPPPAASRLLPRLTMASGWAAALLIGLTLGWYRWRLDAGRAPRSLRSVPVIEVPDRPLTMDRLIENDLSHQLDEMRGTLPTSGARRNDSVRPAVHRTTTKSY